MLSIIINPIIRHLVDSSFSSKCSSLVNVWIPLCVFFYSIWMCFKHYPHKRAVYDQFEPFPVLHFPPQNDYKDKWQTRKAVEFTHHQLYFDIDRHRHITEKCVSDKHIGALKGDANDWFQRNLASSCVLLCLCCTNTQYE